MKIVFRESGGFAPVFRGCELDTDHLSPQEAGQVQSLVDTSGILAMHDRRVQEARDVRLYTFIVETDRGRHRVTFDQLSVPEGVRPLLDLLRAQSRDLLPDNC
ncbi:MAG TPA: protealysin inhibitor emfourin [Chloroflexota bacterium]|nr:protealysin inhibitor emfourin [Chloroflexota bacterium]